MKKHSWVFTLNNYVESDLPLSLRTDQFTTTVLNWKNDNIIYLGYGKEKGANGTPHLQGMIVFNRPVSFKTIKKLNGSAHWQPMKGSFIEAKNYCSKENFIQYLKPNKTLGLVKEKVEDDHLRTELIDREATFLENVAKQQQLLNKRLDKLEKQNEMVLHFLSKLNTQKLLYKDKFS